MTSSANSEQAPRFLSVDEVLKLHAEGIKRYGGDPGIRDYGLVESATLAPQQTWGGEYRCHDLAEMAATYWYNLTRNHGFIDGNKRVGLAACDVFLLMNGYDLELSDDGEALDLALRIATDAVSKEDVANQLREKMKPFAG